MGVNLKNNWIILQKSNCFKEWIIWISDVRKTENKIRIVCTKEMKKK